MKPQKAINTLSAMKENYEGDEFPNEEKALQLGIEALDFFIEFQRVTGNHKDARLPSETKD
ncbi:hypothetical protein ES703_108472 [subsurface metagenome]